MVKSEFGLRGIMPLEIEKKSENKMKSLDEIFSPFRENTEQISEIEIDELVRKARREVFKEEHLKTQKDKKP